MTPSDRANQVGIGSYGAMMNLGQIIRSGAKWLFLGNVGRQFLASVFGVALARLLVAADFGTHSCALVCPRQELETAAAHLIAIIAGRRVHERKSMQGLTYNKESLVSGCIIVE